MTKIVEYAEEDSRASGLLPHFSLSTNCILTKSKIDYLEEHGFSLSVSLDGTQEVQDQNRPFPNGQGSFDVAFGNLKLIDATDIDYGIRSTVLPGTEWNMPEFISLLVKSGLCVRHINFEPVQYTGRAASLAEDDSFFRTFLSNYVKAKRLAASHGIGVSYSACRFGTVCEHFCGAYGSASVNFVVSAVGGISSCNEVTDPSDRKAGLFLYGKITGASRNPVLDHERIKHLQSLRVVSFERCNDCFAKYNCGGDCLARAMTDSPGVEKVPATERCWLNREILKTEMEFSLLNHIWENGIQDNP